MTVKELLGITNVYTPVDLIIYKRKSGTFADKCFSGYGAETLYRSNRQELSYTVRSIEITRAGKLRIKCYKEVN